MLGPCMRPVNPNRSKYCLTPPSQMHVTLDKRTCRINQMQINPPTAGTQSSCPLQLLQGISVSAVTELSWIHRQHHDAEIYPDSWNQSECTNMRHKNHEETGVKRTMICSVTPPTTLPLPCVQAITATTSSRETGLVSL